MTKLDIIHLLQYIKVRNSQIHPKLTHYTVQSTETEKGKVWRRHEKSHTPALFIYV